jgi:hypothetical protein
MPNSFNVKNKTQLNFRAFQIFCSILFTKPSNLSILYTNLRAKLSSPYLFIFFILYYLFLPKASESSDTNSELSRECNKVLSIIKITNSQKLCPWVMLQLWLVVKDLTKWKSAKYQVAMVITAVWAVTLRSLVVFT